MFSDQTLSGEMMVSIWCQAMIRWQHGHMDGVCVGEQAEVSFCLIGLKKQTMSKTSD